MSTRLTGVPWILWVQDILPDGAATTGYVDQGGITYRLSRRLESAAYEAASHIVVLSESFRANLVEKGVPPGEDLLAYNPATMTVDSDSGRSGEHSGAPRVLVMGNIGKSQGLPGIVEAFESDPRLSRPRRRARARRRRSGRRRGPGGDQDRPYEDARGTRPG